MPKSISPVELASQLDRAVLLDVRRKPVFDQASSVIERSTWKDPEQIDAWSTALQSDRFTVVYCAHGHQVSQQCAAALEALGVPAAYLEGGIAGWVEAGLPTVGKNAAAGFQ